MFNIFLLKQKCVVIYAKMNVVHNGEQFTFLNY